MILLFMKKTLPILLLALMPLFGFAQNETLLKKAADKTIEIGKEGIAYSLLKKDGKRKIFSVPTYFSKLGEVYCKVVDNNENKVFDNGDHMYVALEEENIGSMSFGSPINPRYKFGNDSIIKKNSIAYDDVNCNGVKSFISNFNSQKTNDLYKDIIGNEKEVKKVLSKLKVEENKAESKFLFGLKNYFLN